MHRSVHDRPIPLEQQDAATACVLCSHNCGLRVDVSGGRITAVRPDPESPVSQGYICNKAYSIARYVEHGDRVTHPLRRRPDGAFERVSWDEAIAGIAGRLGAIVRDHGPSALAVVGIGGQANHLDAAFAVAFLHGIGSRRWFSAYVQEKTQNHLVDSWMFRASPSVVLHADTARCEYLLVMGTNPRVSHRGHAATDTLRAIAADPARRLVVVDPRRTETARGAHRHLAVKPGADCHLLLAMCARIVQAGLHDRRFLDEHAGETGPILDRLRALDPVTLARRAGLDPDTVFEEADRFARARGAAILWDLGIEQGRFSTLNAYLLRLLSLLTGNVGRPGGMLFIESPVPPAPARAARPPEKARVSGIEAIRALSDEGMFSPSLFPEEVLTDHPERIRAVVVEGANPLVSYADSARWREAFARLELKVVIEPAMTETARLADYVLPCPTGYEKWEISLFPHHHPGITAQLRPPIVTPPGEALPEPEIYCRLIEAMGLLGQPPAILRPLLAVGRGVFTAGLLAAAAIGARGDRAGIQDRAIFWAYQTLGRELPAPSLAAVWMIAQQNALERRAAVIRALGPGHRWRSPFALGRALFERILARPEGTTLAILDDADHLRRNLGTDDGRVCLSPRPMLDELERALAETDGDPELPFVLAAGLRTHFTANTIHRDPAWRKGKGARCALSIHPDDALALGVAEGGSVRVTTRGGAADLPAELDDRLPRGLVSVPNGFGLASGDPPVVHGLNANELTRTGDRDPFTGCPQHKHVPCRVERVDEPRRAR